MTRLLKILLSVVLVTFSCHIHNVDASRNVAVGNEPIGLQGQTNMKAYIKLKHIKDKEAEKAQQARENALMLTRPRTVPASSSPPNGTTSPPIVLATVDCHTPSSVLVRNLLFSISRFTTKEHPVRFYLLHTFNSSLLPHPETLLCKDLLKCRQLLQYLLVEKHIDVRFAPVENNTYVKAFRPCASSHLWLARSLPQEPHVIYLNRDMVVKQDLHALFAMFAWFPPDTVLAATFETNRYFEARPKAVSPYRSGVRDGRGPYWAPPYGLNNGLLLYHLDRMRALRVVEDFEFIIGLNMSLPLADQDITNYYVYQQPFRFKAVPCKWNIRADPKNDRDHCLSKEGSGSSSEQQHEGRGGILHGSRKLFLEAAAKSRHFLASEHPEAEASRYYDRYVNATKELIVEFLKNNELLSHDTHWPE
jgi:hypothetical protein